MNNKVLKYKVAQNELQEKYKRGVSLGSLVVLHDIIDFIENKELSNDDKINKIKEYCFKHKNRLLGKDKTSPDTDKANAV